MDVEKEIKTILDHNPEIIFLNCRLKNPLNINEIEPFGQQFCNERRLGYFRSLQTMVLNMPMVVVNGRYEANSNKVDTAIKAAESLDKLGDINVRRTGSTLEISLDRVPTTASKGVLYLYSYLPAGRDAQGAPKDEGSIDGDSFIATQTPEMTFHPVVNYTQLGDWNGEPISFSHSVADFADSLYDPGSLGYIVVLHEFNSSGPVLAVGELRPDVAQVSSGDAQGVDGPVPAPSQKKALPVTLPNQ